MNCPDCQRLAREVEILRRIDYRAAETKGQELIAHQLTCHFLHIAHAPGSRFTASAEGENSRDDLPVFSPNSHNRVQE